MTRLTRRIEVVAAAALFAVALSFPAAAAPGVDDPTKPVESKTDTKTPDPKADEKAKPADAKPADSKPADSKAPDKKSDLDFRNGYKLAYDTIYSRQDYAAGIVMLRALGQDNHADVANLIGFSSRKLGRTEDAKVWYEKALASDPKHTRTWQYYGLWHLEQGDRTKAQAHLEQIRLICGQGCEDYTSLRDALDGSVSY